jgi:hypothetical protein
MRSPRLLPLLAVVTALVAAAPASSAEIGLNINGGVAASNDMKQFEDLSTLGAKWARHFVFHDDLDHNENGFVPYERMILDEKARGVKTLLTVASARGEAPNADEYARFMGLLAKRFKGEVEAYEVWNEADGSMFWSGGPNAAAYVETLKKAYAAVKEADPAATVVFSPTIGNNFHFLQDAYNQGAKGHFDAMAVHTDTACLDRGPTSFYREPDGRIGQFAFLGYREVYKVMQANGDGDKPIWMTEFGWSATTDRCAHADKPAGVSEAQQAQYLLEAMNCLEEDPYVQVAMWFNNRDLSRDGSMLNSYGLRRANNTTRPAFDAFKTWGAGGGRSSAPCGDFEGPTVRVHTPQPGFVLAPGSNLTMRASTDAEDLNRIWFRVEGPGAAPLFNDGPISLPGEGLTREREWGGARELGNGQHKLIVWATDKNDTPGPEVVVPFAKGEAYEGPGVTPGDTTAAPSFVQFRKLRLLGRGLKRTFAGGSLPGITAGAVRIEWQRKSGRRWKRLHAKAVVARRPFRVTQRLRRPGRWRVRAVYLGRPGIPRTPSCWTVFHTSSTKTSVVCPRGAVKPTR